MRIENENNIGKNNAKNRKYINIKRKQKYCKMRENDILEIRYRRNKLTEKNMKGNTRKQENGVG